MLTCSAIPFLLNSPCIAATQIDYGITSMYSSPPLQNGHFRKLSSTNKTISFLQIMLRDKIVFVVLKSAELSKMECVQTGSSKQAKIIALAVAKPQTPIKLQVLSVRRINLRCRHGAITFNSSVAARRRPLYYNYWYHG